MDMKIEEIVQAGGVKDADHDIRKIQDPDLYAAQFDDMPNPEITDDAIIDLANNSALFKHKITVISLNSLLNITNEYHELHTIYKLVNKLAKIRVNGNENYINLKQEISNCLKARLNELTSEYIS